jgi:hypothetical protein
MGGQVWVLGGTNEQLALNTILNAHSRGNCDCDSGGSNNTFVNFLLPPPPLPLILIPMLTHLNSGLRSVDIHSAATGLVFQCTNKRYAKRVCCDLFACIFVVFGIPA